MRASAGLAGSRDQLGAEAETEAEAESATECQFDAALADLLKAFRCSRRFYATCRNAVSELTAILGFSVLPFGSFAHSTCCKASDLDVALRAADGSPLAVPPVAALARAARHATASGSGFCVLEEVFSARVPVLRLKRKACGLEVDVSVPDQRCCNADSVVSSTIEELEGRDLIVLVKTWARRRGIRGAYEGFLSSYCWTLLSIYVLRKLQQSKAGAEPGDRPSLQAALRAVFEALLQLGSAAARGRAVDALRGLLVPRPSGRHIAGRKAPLFVLDPAQPSGNVARCLTSEGWRMCMVEAKKALQLCLKSDAWAVHALFKEKHQMPGARPTAVRRKRRRAAPLGN